MRAHYKAIYCVILGLLSMPALAQTDAAPAAPPPPGWQFSLTPYGWFPGLGGTLKTPLPRFGDRSFSLGAGNVISDLDAVPIMATGEARYGRFAVVGDIFYSALRNDIQSRDLLWDGGHARAISTIGTLLGMVRVVETPAQGFELGAGFRIWNMKTKVSLNPGLAEGIIQKTAATWSDPVLAARYTAMLSPRFGVTAYGDIGGFGAGSRLTWQAIGSFDYSLTEATILRAGWRYLFVDRSRGSFGADLGFNGPFVAVTFRF